MGSIVAFYRGPQNFFQRAKYGEMSFYPFEIPKINLFLLKMGQLPIA